MPPLGSCLSAVLKSSDALGGISDLAVRPYSADAVSLVGEQHATVPIASVVGDMHAKMLADPQQYILLPGDEMAAMLDRLESGEVDVGPYTDPLLKDESLLEPFVMRLWNRGLVTLRLTCKCKVGIFFVEERSDAAIDFRMQHV